MTNDVITRVGRYSILEEIAKGGMARVFVAQKDGSADICVLKLLHTEQENDLAGAQRLRREAHLLSLMNHPHISLVLDAGFEKGAFFLALEYIPGHTITTIQRTLRQQRRRVPPEVAMVVALDVLDGLGYAHEHRDPDGHAIELVHRDLSPNNVMLSYHGAAKIIDFGIASGKIDAFKTKPGHIMGTPRYLSPEQATMKPIDRRSDLYTLAVVLYGMFTSRPLVKKGPPGQVLVEIVEKIPRPLPEIITDFPEPIWKVLEVALAKDPEQRWQHAREFRDALAASHPWTLPSRQEIGLFLEEYFPEGKKNADALYARGRANAPAIVTPGGFFDTTGIDLPLPQKGPITEPELIPADLGVETATDVMRHSDDYARTADLIGVSEPLHSGPTMANDPFPDGVLELPEERRIPMARRATDPPARAVPSKMGIWIVLLLMSIGLGVGAALVLSQLGS